MEGMEGAAPLRVTAIDDAFAAVISAVPSAAISAQKAIV